MAKEKDLEQAEGQQMPVENKVESLIRVIRGQQVMLDRDLAELYGVETRRLNEQVKRNVERFPKDFMFQLAKEETEILKCQIGISRWGGDRYRPYAFTEQGVAMIYTQQISRQFRLDIDRHNSQYPPIEVSVFRRSHDRFLCIDDTVYHVGASIKDLGKKWFAFSKMEDFKPEELVARINEAS